MAEWKKLSDMKLIGKEYTRVDGVDKVTGKAKYTYDIQLPGMLYGKILRSPHPHAKIISIDSSKVEQMAGVVSVVTDLKDEVLYVGDEVAAVAAVSEEIAEEALKLFDVNYEELPFTVVEEEAMKPDAPIFTSGKEDNLGQNRDNSSGNITQGFREAEVVVEGTFK